MQDDEVMEKARKAAQAARKVVAAAEAALSRTDEYFRSRGMDPDGLTRLLEQQGGPEARREIESMVEIALQDVKREADEAIRESWKVKSPPSAKRRPRQFI